MGQVIERNGHLYLRYDLGPHPKTGKRRRRMVAFKGTPKDAWRELQRLEAEVKAGTGVDPSKLTLGEWLEQWLDDNRQTLAAKTVWRYEDIIRLHLAPNLGAIKLQALKPEDVSAYYRQARKTGRLDGQGGLSEQTLLHYHRLLSTALKAAVTSDLLQRNPLERVRSPRPARVERKTLEAADVRRLLQHLSGTWLHLPVLLLVYTGMRRGEVLALQWRDVDLEARTLTNRRAVEQGRGTLGQKGTKGGKVHTIPLPAPVVAAIQAARPEKPGPGALVIAWEDGRQIRPDVLTHAFTRTVRELGLDCTLHGLRHTVATLGLEAGLPLSVMSDLLGHGDVGITDRIYTHVLPRVERAAMDKIAGIIEGEK